MDAEVWNRALLAIQRANDALYGLMFEDVDVVKDALWLGQKAINEVGRVEERERILREGMRHEVNRLYRLIGAPYQVPEVQLRETADRLSALVETTQERVDRARGVPLSQSDADEWLAALKVATAQRDQGYRERDNLRLLVRQVANRCEFLLDDGDPLTSLQRAILDDTRKNLLRQGMTEPMGDDDGR